MGVGGASNKISFRNYQSPNTIGLTDMKYSDVYLQLGNYMQLNLEAVLRNTVFHACVNILYFPLA
jgi:hypothetical protein